MPKTSFLSLSFFFFFFFAQRSSTNLFTTSLPNIHHLKPTASGQKLMTSFDDTFSGFLDHYILLLAARFKAPIHTWNGRTTSGLIDDPASTAWTMVSRCVQEVMNASSTQTPSERQQLKHVDVALFTPQVCRERAMYLQWRIQKEERARKESKKTRKSKKGGEEEANGGPSSFDVTKDSLSNDVMSLFDAVRRNLPSALLERDSGSDSDSDTDEDNNLDVVDVDLARKRVAAAAKKGGEVSAFYLQAGTIVDVPMRSDEQVKQDREMAKARDAMLSKVQDMQTDFFNKYRRWVDVPADLMDAPPVMTMPIGRADGPEPRPVPPLNAGHPLHHHTSSSLPSASVGRTTHSHPPPPHSQVETPTTPPSGFGSAATATTMPSDASEMLQELKRRMNVDRPSRPSAMTDEGIEAMYANSAPPPPMDVHLPGGPFSSSRPDSTLTGKTTMPPSTSSSSPTASPPQALRGSGAAVSRFGGQPSASAPVPHSGTASSTSSNVHKVTKETAAPTVAGRRAGRLQVLEYDD